MFEFMEEEGFATWPQIYVLAVFSIGFLVSVVYILLTPSKGDELTEDEERALYVKHLPVFGANFTSSCAPPPRRRQAPAEPAAASKGVEVEEAAEEEAAAEEVEEEAAPEPQEEEVEEAAAEEVAVEPEEVAPKKGKKKKNKGKAAKEEEEAPPPVEVEEAAPAKELSPLQKSIQNDIRKHQKKLREVTDLKAKQEGGEQLTEGQKAKVANEAELLRLISEANEAMEKAIQDEAKEEEAKAQEPEPAAEEVCEEEAAAAQEEEAEEEAAEEEEAEEAAEAEAEEAAEEEEQEEAADEAEGHEEAEEKEDEDEDEEDEDEDEEDEEAAPKGEEEAAAPEAEEEAPEEPVEEEPEKKEEPKKYEGPPRKGGLLTTPLTLREKELLKIKKKMREIEQLEQKETEGEVLAPNQRAKVDKKDALVKDLNEWEEAVEDYTVFVKGEVKEVMNPLIGVKVAIPGHEKPLLLPAALMNPPVYSENFLQIRERHREGHKVQVRVLRDNAQVTELTIEDEEIRVPEIEGVMGEFDALKSEDERKLEEIKALGTWSKDWHEGKVSAVKNFGVFCWVWGCREILVRNDSILPNLMVWDPDRGEQGPDRYSIAPGAQVRLKLKWLPANAKYEAKVIGSMIDHDA